MAASQKTAREVTRILVEELGAEKARAVIVRIVRETCGNASYNDSIVRLLEAIDEQMKEKT